MANKSAKKPTPDQLRRLGPTAARLRQALNDRGWNYAQLGRAIGIRGDAMSSTVSNWANAQNGISPKYLLKVAKALDVPEGELKVGSSVPAKATQQAVTVYRPPALPERSFSIDQIPTSNGGEVMVRFKLDAPMTMGQANALMGYMVTALHWNVTAAAKTQ